MYKYFPNDKKKLNSVIGIYEEEIKNRIDWIANSCKNLNEASEKGIDMDTHYVIGECMNIISHAMVIYRMVDLTASTTHSARNKPMALERAKILHNKHPNLPELPKELKRVRNSFEHYEEKLDEWVARATKNDNNFIHISMSASFTNFDFKNSKYHTTFRRFAYPELSFWEEKVDFQKIIDWTTEVYTIILRNPSNL